MNPTWRKPAGIFLILLVIIPVWAILVIAGAELIGKTPWPLQALYFIVAGLIWIAPLKPLLQWMETGRWTRPRG